MSLTNEEHEEKILWILKRIGMREVVEICQSGVIFLASLLILVTPLVIWMKFSIFVNVGLPLMFLYVWAIATQMYLIDIILNYSFKGAIGGLFKFVYYMSQATLGFLSVFQPQITEGFFYLNAIFPYTQASNFCKLSMVG